MGIGNYDALVGRRVGRWTVVRMEDRIREANGRLPAARAFCVCDCGSSKPVLVNNLLRETTQSCGCLVSEVTAARNARSRGRKPANYSHGKTNHYLYSTWAGIKSRCYNPNATSYRYYGAVGVAMCDDWKCNFSSFYNYVIDTLGDRPSARFTIDRIDVSRDYEPGNIRWADWDVQSNNARSNIRLTFRGETLTLSQWCQKLNLKYQTVRDRVVKLAWSVERALSTPAPCYSGTNPVVCSRNSEAG